MKKYRPEMTPAEEASRVYFDAISHMSRAERRTARGRVLVAEARVKALEAQIKAMERKSHD